MRSGALAMEDAPRAGRRSRAPAPPAEDSLRPAPTEAAPLAPLTFSAVYQQHFHDVCRWLAAMGCRTSDLEDVAQDVFVVVERKLAGFDGRNLPGWLYAITTRLASAHRRRAWFRRLLFWPRAGDEDQVASDRGPARILEELQAQRVVERVLAQMSVKHRTTFVLFEIEGYSSEQIAEFQGVPHATVRTRLFHARRAFRDLFEAIDREPGDPSATGGEGER